MVKVSVSGPVTTTKRPSMLQAAFAVWQRDAADYQRGYDAFLEKEFQNQRAPHYSSSHVWMTAVDDLRIKVTCAHEQGQGLSHRVVRRAVKLLHMHRRQQPNGVVVVPRLERNVRQAGKLANLEVRLHRSCLSS